MPSWVLIHHGIARSSGQLVDCWEPIRAEHAGVTSEHGMLGKCLFFGTGAVSPWITIIYCHIHLSLISQLEMFKRWFESPASCLYNPLLYLVMTGRLVSGLRNTYNMLSWFRIFGGGCIHFEENTVSNIINSPLVELLQLTRNTEKILPCNIIKKYWHFESY